MKENKAPSFRFYVKDWLSSATILKMTVEQEGAYIRLLAHCWDDVDCSLPDDDDILAIFSRMGSRFKGSSTVVKKAFIKHPTKEGHLTHEKLMQQRVLQEEWRKKCSLAGKKSSKQRNKHLKK